MYTFNLPTIIFFRNLYNDHINEDSSYFSNHITDSSVYKSASLIFYFAATTPTACMYTKPSARTRIIVNARN